MIDLHLHTNCSDGTQTPAQVAEEARKAGLSAIAYTDHNCFVLQQGRTEQGLELLPGCEFSTIYTDEQGRRREIHMIGLFFRSVPDEIVKLIASIDRNAYPQAILRSLNRLGFPLTMERIRQEYPDAEHIGRMHIAKVMVAEGYAKDTEEVFDRWIGNFSPYYIDPLETVHYPSMETVVGALSSCRGAIAVLAHPFHYRFTETEVEGMIRKFRACTDRPLAMEVFYGSYEKEQVEWLGRMAEKYDLLVSAGSDRHREDQPFQKGDDLLLQKMRQALEAE